MPIANCIITPDCQESSSDLIELWALESGQSSEHMTINIIVGKKQFGKKYSVMATLFLPSVWSDSGIASLQRGLAKALTQHFNLASSQVHVITSLVNSGMVVENGQTVKW